MLLEYSFEFRLNGGALQCRYSSFGFSVNEYSHFQGMNLFRQNLLLSFSIKKMTKIRLYSQDNCSKNVETIEQFRYIKIIACLQGLEE